MGALLATCAIALAEPALATFPGANGRIVFSVQNDTESEAECLTPSCVEHRLASVNPRSGRTLRFRPCTDPVECNDLHPAVSPDGRWIAYERYAHSNPTAPNTQVDRFYLAVTGMQGRRVRTVTEPAFHPAWSPDGRWIAYSDGHGVQLVSPDGSQRRSVLPGPASELDWSTRDRIAFVRYRGRHGSIYSVARDGSGLRRLTRESDARGPSWSPDGRSLAFERVRARGVDILVRTAGTTRRVVRGGAEPVWSPDGKQIAFVRRRSIWLLRLDDGSSRRLHRVGRRSAIGSLSWRAVPR